MLKNLILSLILFYVNILPLLAEKPMREENARTGETQSSSTRGCSEKLPQITLKNSPLYQEKPEIQVIASQKGFPILAAIYPVSFQSTEYWQTTVMSRTDWLTLTPPMIFKKERQYAVALTIPCQGDLRSGERIYKVIELN